MASFKVKADTVIAIFLLAAGVVFWFAIAEAPRQAKYYPRFLLGLAAVPTILLLARSLCLKDEAKNRDLSLRVHRRVLVCIGATALYIFLIKILGYYVTTSLFIAGIMAFLGARKAVTIAGTSLAMTLFIYLMFSRLLLISLPRGLLF